MSSEIVNQSPALPAAGLPEPDAAPGGGRPRPWRLGFWSLIVTQFQNAFNDNALKFLVIYIIIATGSSAQRRDLLVMIVSALFALPFLLFSMTGGYFADRHSKRGVVIGTKLMEIGVMAVAIAGFAIHNLVLECAGVFLISTQSALFGPSKYGLLPEILPEPELSWGNGVLELGTFVGSIAATMAAAIMAQRFHGREAIAGWILLGCTLFGLAASFGISRVPAADPSRRHTNPVSDLLHQWRTVRADRVLAWAVWGNTYLWFLAALLQLAVVLFGTLVLRLDDAHTSYLQIALSIGIGAGSFAAGYLSDDKIEMGLIPLGAIGMTVFGGLLFPFGHGLRSAGTLLALLGFFGGFFAVPISALIQHRPRPEQKGGVLALANFLSFVGVFLAGGAYYLAARELHQNPRGIFLDGALLTLVMTAYSVWLLPDSLVRFCLWLITHSVYRLRVEGRENIPAEGGALLVCNHLSFVDALLLIASTDRPVRFLMYRAIYDLPYVKPFARLVRAIPISSEQRPREMLQSLREAQNALRAGELVCIFAEGQITRTGLLLPFRRGMERILKGVDVPVIPVNLDGVWGSIFSFERGRFLWKLPQRLRYPVTVSFGRAMPASSAPLDVRHAVQELQSLAYAHRKPRMKTLHRRFVATAHGRPFGFAMGDRQRRRMGWGAALLGTIFLARRLRRAWRGQQMVGILLPPSVAGALVNYAALLAGKIPVNLNYTASSETLASCAAQCGLQTVITARPLVEKLPLRVPVRTIWIEDAAANPGIFERLWAFALWFLPGSLLERAIAGRAASVDDLATVIFSSGSTGDPKGVMLSHYNIGSNVEQMAQAFMLGPRDVLLGVLPFFHSFGFTVTLWLPAVLGVGAAYHANPLELGAIGEIVRDYRVTFLLATPSFLQAYYRRCSPEDFGSVQFVLVGAEKLPERLALEFEDRFGIRPLEGYGATECAPVVAVNTRDFRAPGFRQAGAKRGSIGHPLPGVSIRIVDPETRQAMPPGAAGLLLVRGPNVMQGYLGKPERTAEVLQDGWYDTGDIAAEDEDGFLSITDRLSRFSKIGGEMVPHVKIETKLHELATATEQVFAVTGVPDPGKGERLVVLHTVEPADLDIVLAKLPESGLPNLWLPRPNRFYRVPELPRLGTGKLDLRRVREIAAELSTDS